MKQPNHTRRTVRRKLRLLAYMLSKCQNEVARRKLLSEQQVAQAQLVLISQQQFIELCEQK